MMDVLVLGEPLFSSFFFFEAHTFYPKFGCFKPKLQQGFFPIIAVIIQHDNDNLHNKHCECNA